MKSFRSVNVRGKLYSWKYVYDDLDFENYPYSYYLIIPDENKKFILKVLFRELEPPMILERDEGTLAFFEGKEMYLNLNRPRYVVQIIEYLLAKNIDFNKSETLIYEKGEMIFRELGYKFDDYSARCNQE
ncbi:MAG: hypothetical protein ACI4F4_07030 [Lachnospiraceae bacterium]